MEIFKFNRASFKSLIIINKDTELFSLFGLYTGSTHIVQIVGKKDQIPGAFGGKMLLSVEMQMITKYNIREIKWIYHALLVLWLWIAPWRKYLSSIFKMIFFDLAFACSFVNLWSMRKSSSLWLRSLSFISYFCQ